jgi:hypothetical protein
MLMVQLLAAVAAALPSVQAAGRPWPFELEHGVQIVFATTEI